MRGYRARAECHLPVWEFAASLTETLITALRNYLVADGMAVIGSALGLAFSAAMLVVASSLLIYSRA